MKLVRALAALVLSIPRNGLAQNARLLRYCIYIPLKMKLYPLLLVIYRGYLVVERRLLLNRRLNALRDRADELVDQGERSRVSLDDLIASRQQVDAIRRAQEPQATLVIAEIDQDGNWLSHFGEIPAVPMVSGDRFLERKRYRLQVVLHRDEVGVRKHFGRDRLSFVNEVTILDLLAKAGCDAPPILDVDVEGLSLTVGYLKGRVLREELARSGADLRDREAGHDEGLSRSELGERRRLRIEEGRRVLHRVIDEAFTERAFEELSRMHAARVVWRDIKYGNMIIEDGSGAPFLIDFDLSFDCPRLSAEMFTRLRDGDIEKFNEHFGTEKLTYERLAEKLKGMKVYAPVYFGAGLRAGPIWRVDNGFGRWHYILKHNYPPFVGKRILDLGPNNGHNAMQLLREGARAVVGVELDEAFIEQAKLVKAGYEWADNKTYDFTVIQSNMAEIPRLGLGEFDIVQALCSLYYLSEEQMNEVARFVGTISEYFLLQCNLQSDIGRDDAQTYEKATVEFAVALLEKNGFEVVKVVAPFRYARPLVLGRRRSGT